MYVQLGKVEKQILLCIILCCKSIINLYPGINEKLNLTYLPRKTSSKVSFSHSADYQFLSSEERNQNFKPYDDPFF